MGIALLPVLATGCYTLVPVALGDPPLTTNVRANLSQAARQRLWAVVPADRRYLEGKLVARDGDSLLVDVTIQGVAETTTFLQRIPLSRDDLVSLETRHLDPFRTAVAGALFAGVATALVVSIFTGEAGGGAFPPVDPGLTESVVAGFVPWVR
ncbi:MAG: hypothetical protein EXR93_07330 [Gemmatimonadetes bacterium]|nr:hypothetical protein [Gemmatimonadota bacterium]